MVAALINEGATTMNISERIWLTVSVLVGKVEDRKNEEGITAIEYAVMAAAIVAIIVAAVAILGTKINSLFNGITV
jgi:Flp pilus assembly pilin Flp